MIADSFSADKTKEIFSQKYPQAKFFKKKFNGYGEQRTIPLLYIYSYGDSQPQNITVI
ncbi:hypothetical protein ACP3T3_12500 [Chryseobacterium sp. CBSDS_008]|uniref:hypothetical protein n=1 Tax=Chryseobacterium sp. CBSDS_008 TaxID=3415265 RepID=UPI003CEE2396